MTGATLTGRVCVLAGGTGGIGAVVAGILHAEGAPLVLGYRGDRERAEHVAAELRRAGSVPISLVEGDLYDAGTRRALVDAARALGDPYGLVVLAGDPARPKAGAPTQDEMQRSMQDNYLGPVLLARDFRAALGVAGGAVVLLSTMQAIVPFEGSLAYAGPKAALVHAARVMAKEWGGRDDVRVNVVAPGVTAAGMAETSIRSGKYDRFVDGDVIRRFGRPEDVARAIRFFLEPDGYVTGQVLVVDGGLTLRRDVLAS
ncbi:MAG: SDR family oxidoreductase [Deltaproteobacteria bacterium]|nr:SDR family oxidoreductase [Deltaproteobacteria bacterium]